MIRILQMGMTDNLGGIETYLINYYKNIDKSIIQFDFINIYENNLCFQEEILDMGGKVYKVPSYYKKPIRYIKAVKKIIEENNYEIVHCNMNSAAMLYPLIAAKFAGAKVIIAHSHNNSSDKGIIKTLLHNINKHFIPFFANYFFACSKEAGRWFFTKKNISSSYFKIIKNAIDTKKFTYNEDIRRKTRERLKIDNDTFVVGHVGRFSPQKNHNFLIDIFYEIKKKNINSKLILIGIGPEKENIELKVKKLKLDNSVLFLGKREDVNELMQAMDAFVFPSLYEGLGIVLVEAQAAGLPCVTTNQVPEIVKLSQSFDKISLKEDLEYWSTQILKYKTNDREVSNKVKEFDIKKCSNEIVNLYTEINKIKICHFVNGIVNGGVERVLINYFKYIEREHYDLHIITQGESDLKNLKEFEELDFKVHTVSSKKQGFLKNYRQIKQILDREKFDIIHCHMTSTNLFPLFYGWISGVKVRISHSHLNEPNTNLFIKILIKLARIFATYKIACSKDAANYLFGKNKKIYILNNAIELEKFSYSESIRNKVRTELGVGKNDILIGHIGRFVEQKNHKFLVQLFNELHIKNKNYKLILIGIGELQEDIKKQIKEMKLESSVLFLDTRDDVNELMQAMDIFVLPSLYEGLGIVLIEAQTSGVKCFSSSNIPTEVEVTQNIKLLNLDIDKWVEEINNLNNFERRDYIQEISIKGFNIKLEAEKLDSIYKNMVRK